MLLNIENKYTFNGIIIGGDINLNLFNKNSQTEKFNDILNNYGLDQLVSKFTYPANYNLNINKFLIYVLAVRVY